MPPRLHKCCFCEQPIAPDQEEVPFKSRYAHIRCFNVYMSGLQRNKQEQLAEAKVKKQSQTVQKQVEQIAKKEPKQGLTEAEYKEKQEYFSYLQTSLGEITAKHRVVTERYREQYSFDYRGMHFTLLYLTEVLNKPFDSENDGLGLIPYYYNAATRYYNLIEETNQKNNNTDSSDFYKSKIIKVKSFKAPVKQLDIGAIGVSE